MHPIPRWLKTPRAMLLPPLMLAAGCAAPPTKEEVAALDYGACPTNHVSVIKERFKGGLLNAYAGEPVIWPPQKFWYRDPLPGAPVYAGYLVPVMAHLERGNRMLLGKQIYGFIFKNDQMVKEINPNLMRNLRFGQNVGPLPRDERVWSLGHSAGDDRLTLQEWVVGGESVKDWSELVTIQILHGVPLEVTGEFVAARAGELHRKNCTDFAQTPISSTPIEYLYEQRNARCAPFRDEHSIRKAIRGPREIIEVSYTKVGAMNADEKAKWTGIVSRVQLMDECKGPVS